MKNQVNFFISIAKNCLQSKESKLAPKKPLRQQRSLPVEARVNIQPAPIDDSDTLVEEQSFGEPRTAAEIAADARGDMVVVVPYSDGRVGVPRRFNTTVGLCTEVPDIGYVKGNKCFKFLKINHIFSSCNCERASKNLYRG